MCICIAKRYNWKQIFLISKEYYDKIHCSKEKLLQKKYDLGNKLSETLLGYCMFIDGHNQQKLENMWKGPSVKQKLNFTELY